MSLSDVVSFNNRSYDPESIRRKFESMNHDDMRLLRNLSMSIFDYGRFTGFDPINAYNTLITELDTSTDEEKKHKIKEVLSYLLFTLMFELDVLRESFESTSSYFRDQYSAIRYYVLDTISRYKEPLFLDMLRNAYKSIKYGRSIVENIVKDDKVDIKLRRLLVRYAIANSLEEGNQLLERYNLE